MTNSRLGRSYQSNRLVILVAHLATCDFWPRMKTIPLHITPHHLTISNPVREFLRIKISALARFAGDILSAEVVLRGPSGAAHQFSVSARLALPGRDVHGHATHSNLHGAVNRLVARLGRLSRKRKTRLSSVVRRPLKRSAAIHNKSLSN